MSPAAASATGNAKRIAVIPGDGIGKEVIPEAVKVLQAAAGAGGKQIGRASCRERV